MKHFSLVAILVIALLGTLPHSAFSQVLSDPIGDTYGPGPVQIDISSYSVTYTASLLNVFVGFAAPIASPSSMQPNSVTGYLDLDTDQNANTGTTPFVQLFGQSPTPSLGDEFLVDFGSEANHPGTIDVIDTSSFTAVGTIPISYRTDNFNFSVPLSLLGNSNGLLNYAILVGTTTDPTDQAPNGTVPETSVPAAPPVPESSTFVSLGGGLLLLGGLLLITRRRTRKSAS